MKKIFFAALLLLPLSSHALLEIRAGYGLNTFDEDNYAGTELQKMTALNLDVIFEPPVLTDLGLGIRYEKMAFDIKSGGATVDEAEMSRIAALINYRIIDFVAYFGVIGTVGISNQFETNNDSDFDEKLNYSVGVEGGMNIGIFSVGGELGKLFAEVENPGSPDLDLESIYAKILVGIDF
jgi:hypothetical protein